MYVVVSRQPFQTYNVANNLFSPSVRWVWNSSNIRCPLDILASPEYFISSNCICNFAYICMHTYKFNGICFHLKGLQTFSSFNLANCLLFSSLRFSKCLLVSPWDKNRSTTSYTHIIREIEQQIQQQAYTWISETPVVSLIFASASS